MFACFDLICAVSREKPYVVGIAGASASGKTTFIHQLRNAFGLHQVCVVSQDNYYKPMSEQEVDDTGEVNFDLPRAIDFKRLNKDVRQLQQGKTVEIVEYTFNNPSVFPKTIVMQPAPIIVVEGLFVYEDIKLAKCFDLKLYIEARLDVMLERRLIRDSTERGMTKEQILKQWEEHVLPAYESYLLPYRENVDMIILNNTHFQQSLEVVIHHLQTILG